MEQLCAGVEHFIEVDCRLRCANPTEAAVKPRGLDPHLQLQFLRSTHHYHCVRSCAPPRLLDCFESASIQSAVCHSPLFFLSLIKSVFFSCYLCIALPCHMDTSDVNNFSSLPSPPSLSSLPLLPSLSCPSFYFTTSCPWVMSAWDHEGRASPRSMTAEDTSFKVSD